MRDKTTHTFNCEYTAFHSFQPNAATTVNTKGRPIQATVVEEDIQDGGTTASFELVGSISCYDKLRRHTWLNQVNIMEIVGCVHSGIHLWDMMSLFKNLKEVTIAIVGQHPPVDIRPDEMKSNEVIRHMTIKSDWVWDDTKQECNRGVVSVILFSLEMMQRCTKLSSFHIEIPGDNDQKLTKAVWDFLRRSKFDTVITLIAKQQKIVCIQPPVEFENIAVPRTPQLTPRDPRRIPPPPPSLAGPTLPQSAVHLPLPAAESLGSPTPSKLRKMQPKPPQNTN